MKQIALHGKHGEGLFALISDEDYVYLNNFRWCVVVDKKTSHLNYAIRGDGKYMHRVIIGDKSGMVVDHINRKTLDNRRENLRHLNPSDSVKNRDKKIFNDMRGTGVTRKGKQYQSQVNSDGKYHYLGLFNSWEEAHQVYLNYKVSL